MENNKKKMAKEEMLKLLSQMMSGEMYGDMGEGLKSKKMEKVTVMAPDKKGLEKGLSKAQMLMKAKFGEEPEMDESEMHEMSESPEMESSEDACEMCKGEGCPLCSSKEMEEDSE